MGKDKFSLIKSNFLLRNRTVISLLLTIIIFSFIIPSVFSQAGVKRELLCWWCETCLDYCQDIDVVVQDNHVTVDVSFSFNKEKYPDMKEITMIIPNKLELLRKTKSIQNFVGYSVNKSGYVIAFPFSKEEYNVNLNPVDSETQVIIDLTPGCPSWYGIIDCRVSYRYSLEISVDKEGKKTLIYNPQKTEGFDNIPTRVLVRGLGINNKILYSSIESQGIKSDEGYSFETSNPDGEIIEQIKIEWQEQEVQEKYTYGLSKIYWFSFVYAFFMIPSVFLFGSFYKLNNKDKLKAILLCLISYIVMLPATFWSVGKPTFFMAYKSVSFLASFFYHIPLAVFLSIWFKPKYSFTKTVIISVIIASVITTLGFSFLTAFD
jgi:hypothetical protein